MNQRLWITLRLYAIGSPMKRAAYLKKKGVFHHIGERVMIAPRKIPLYANLISLGNNVWIASGVEFITHDVIHFMLNGLRDGTSYEEKIGCIAVGNNVFLGAGSKILYDVKIGDNVIVAAGSVVTRDVPSGSVVGGVPAQVIGNFEDFREKRKHFHQNHPPDNAHQTASALCESEAWEQFEQTHPL